MESKRKFEECYEDHDKAYETNIIKRSKMYKEFEENFKDSSEENSEEFEINKDIIDKYPRCDSLINIKSIDDIFNIIKFITYWDIDSRDLTNIENTMYNFLFYHRTVFLKNYQKIIDNIDISIPYRAIFLVSIGINPNTIYFIPNTLPNLEKIMKESVKYSHCDSLSLYIMNTYTIELKEIYFTNALKFSNKRMINYFKNLISAINNDTIYYLFRYYVNENVSCEDLLKIFKIDNNFQNIIASFGSIELLTFLHDNNLLTYKYCISLASKNGHLETVRYLMSIFDYENGAQDMFYINPLVKMYVNAIANGHSFIFHQFLAENKIEIRLVNQIVLDLINYPFTIMNDHTIFRHNITLFNYQQNNVKDQPNFNISYYYHDILFFLKKIYEINPLYFTGFNIDPIIFIYFIREKKIDCLKFLFQMYTMFQPNMNKELILTIIKFGNSEILKEFHLISKYIFKNESKLTSLAAKFNKLDILRYLTKNGSKKNKNVITIAIKNHNKEIFNYAVRNKYPFAKDEIIAEEKLKYSMSKHVLNTLK